MPSDYQAIAERNRVRYGTEVDIYGPVLLANLYSDRTHFIFELLQNAEDAGATTITFRLTSTALEVVHNGRPFNENDVHGVCGIVAGTKRDDLSTIGRFGIGFKSVYAYTSSPEIHSADEHFAIRHYVLPYAVPARGDGTSRTLQVFPFDQPEISPEQASREISMRLRRLQPRTILFLRNIRSVEWIIKGAERQVLRRETRPNGPARRIQVSASQAKEDIVDEIWLVYSRAIRGHESPGPKVEIAFQLLRDEKTGKDQVVPAIATELVAFFPTEKETHLGFLVQGPYRTTPARDNVSTDDEWNRELVRLTAELVSDTLLHLKQQRMLTISCLEALPLNAQDFPREHMLYPIFDAVHRSFVEHALLPKHGGGFGRSGEVALARASSLRELLTSEQLQMLLDADLEGVMHFRPGAV
jgi:hypothetical protein